MYNPCIFEQLPIFKTFPTNIGNQQANTCNRAAAAPVARSNVKFDTVATEEGLLLTLKKPLSNKTEYKSELQNRIYEIKNKYSQVPKYSLVSDMWGNQYYVDVTAKIQEKMIEELNSIDMTSFGRRLSKQSFGDYELELNHDGSVLNVSSERDSLNKNLQFGRALKDFYVKSCTVEDDSIAVLKIAIVLENPKVAETAAAASSSTGSDTLEKLINWAEEESASRDNVKQQQRYDQLVGCSSMNACKKIQKKKDQEERNKKEQQEKTRRSEIKRQKKYEQYKLRKQHEQEQKAKKEASETRLVEEQRKKVEAMIQRQVAEEKQKAAIERKREAEAAERQRIAEQQELTRQRAAAEEKQRLELRAKELAERQKAAEIAQRKANEETERLKREQMILEQQEYQRQLVEEERQRKAAQLLSKSQATPVISQSDSEDIDEDMDVDSESDNVSTTLRKYSSPLLEEVDDEEIDRYNDSISQRKPSNGGYEPIIEDK